MTHVPASPAARTRAIKRYLWAQPQRFVATCALGAEAFLHREVRVLDAVSASATRPGGVVFDAPFDTLYPALLRLRCAESLRVVLVDNVAAGTHTMLFDQLLRGRWSLWLPERIALSVRVSSRRSRLRDAAALEATLRDALARHGVQHDTSGSQQLLHLRLEHDRASVSLDLGGPLYRRSGDKWVSKTTIRESTAAALVAAARTVLPDPDLVVDPFCGSGTLLSESLEACLGLPAGRRREAPIASAPAWKPERARYALQQLSAAQVDAAPPHLGSDVDAKAVRVARRNLDQHELTRYADLREADARSLELTAIAEQHAAQRPLLLTNPPYGRAAVAVGADPAQLVRQLVTRAQGWHVALLYPNMGVLDALPEVEVVQRHALVTGGLRNALLIARVRPLAR